MRLLLDTNILVFMWTNKSDSISHDTLAFLEDYSNLLFTSSICVAELIHICQIGKIANIHGKNKSARDVIRWLEDAGVEMLFFTPDNLKTFASLPIYENHHDPNDRLIIAQAISDKIPLISSDRKFEQYRKEGLDFIFNKR
jgi:PIN domain nuclease of toxin-antitoxin system